jgi:hypothetical protein
VEVGEMRKRVRGIPAFLVLTIGLAEAAVSDPFSKPLETYGPMLNGVLERVGSDLRFNPGTCHGASHPTCRFSSSRVVVSVEGRAGQGGISSIVIAADLLREHPAALPHVAVIDAVVTLTATMMHYDPEMPRRQRDMLVSGLLEAAHGLGQGKGSGIAADYSMALDQAGTTLLVITVAPKAR